MTPPTHCVSICQFRRGLTAAWHAAVAARPVPGATVRRNTASARRGGRQSGANSGDKRRWNYIPINVGVTEPHHAQTALPSTVGRGDISGGKASSKQSAERTA